MESVAPGGERRHLTWRDLPASPPTGPVWAAELPPQSAIPAAIAAAPARPIRRRTVGLVGGAALGVLALITVFAVANPLASSGTTPATGTGSAGSGSAAGNGSGGNGRQRLGRQVRARRSANAGPRGHIGQLRAPRRHRSSHPAVGRPDRNGRRPRHRVRG